VLLDIPLSGTRRVPYTVTVELLFQPLGYRWIENLRQADGAEVEDFLRYASAVPNAPVVVARAEAQVGG
jgi:hypothetical protein